MIKEEQYHWEHLFLGHSFRNKKFLSMLKIRNKRFFLALNEHFVPIFNSNLLIMQQEQQIQDPVLATVWLLCEIKNAGCTW